MRSRERVRSNPPPKIEADPPAPAIDKRWTIALLLLGVLGCVAAGNDMPAQRWLLLCAAVAVSMLPPVNRFLGHWIERLRRPSPRAMEWTGLLIAAAATVYLVGTAFQQGRELFPKTEDDCSYVIGAQMLARGRLWMPAHPLSDFFESVFVIVKPVYCSIYFPGTAMWFAPMAWLHWPSWVIPALTAGAAVGLVYRIVTDLIDGAAGVLAAVWMLSLHWFRMLSVMAMSHVPMLLMALLMIWTWLRWRRQKRLGWAIALGIVSGWAAITRPADALAFAIPIGVAMAWELLRQPARKWLVTGAALLLGAAPFLSVQLVFNYGVTGNLLRSPYTQYLLEDQPGTEFGIRPFDPSRRPVSKLPEKGGIFEWCGPFMRDHQPGNFLSAWVHRQLRSSGYNPSNLVTLTNTTLPARLLVVVMFAGLPLLTRSRGRLVLAAVLPTFLGIYLFNPFFLKHYAVVIAPVMIFMVLLGTAAVAATWPRWSRQIGVVCFVTVLAASVTSLWQVYRFMPSAEIAASDDMLEAPILSTLNVELPVRLQQPAVVLFRQASRLIRYFVEPVYNTDVAWPDDAPIIRAHDLGARDGEIISYYAGRQPERMFYVFDTDSGVLWPVGTASALRHRLDSGETLQAIMRPPAMP